jgi:transposase
MVIIEIDAHKRSHTVVVVDEQGRQLAQTTTGTTSSDYLQLLAWAAKHGAHRVWAVEDCRHLSRRLERDLLAAGERILRVPLKLMANARDSARSFGKSNPIDALAVARAALREPNLPVARLDGSEREVRLLVDHREDLLQERTRMISRLRWHLHELDPGAEPAARSLNHLRNLDKLAAYLADMDGVVARLAREITERCRQLSVEIKQLEKEITGLVQELARRSSQSAAAGRSPPQRSSVRPQASNASKAATPMPATTAPRRCQSGHRISSGTGSAAPVTGSSTQRSTASRSPRRTGTPTRKR